MQPFDLSWCVLALKKRFLILTCVEECVVASRATSFTNSGYCYIALWTACFNFYLFVILTLMQHRCQVWYFIKIYLLKAGYRSFSLVYAALTFLHNFFDLEFFQNHLHSRFHLNLWLKYCLNLQFMPLNLSPKSLQ